MLELAIILAVCLGIIPILCCMHSSRISAGQRETRGYDDWGEPR